jgi:hypothetical protein
MTKPPLPFTPSAVAIGAVVAATNGREMHPRLTSSPRVTTRVPRSALLPTPTPNPPELTETERWNQQVDRTKAKRRLDKLLTKMFGSPEEAQNALSAE